MADGSIDAFDVMLGRKIQENRGKWLGIYVARAFRQGHMAVEIKGPEFFPSIESVFAEDGASPLDSLAAATMKGEICKDVFNEAFASGQLIVEGSCIALPHAHVVEVQLAKEMARLSVATPYIRVPGNQIDESLNEGQSLAVVGAMKKALCLITGGPGTGKTYTAGVFLRCLVRDTSVRPLRVAVVAPTGRAVQTLEASIRRMVDGGVGVIIEAKTIHGLVASSKSFVPYHIVIIDECSMIDSDVMLQLLQRLHSGTRVLMLGDPDQLPSIDPGQPFFEFLKVAKEEKRISHFALTECRRTTSEQLLDLANLVRTGDSYQFSEWFASKNGKDVSCVECTTQDEWHQAQKLIENEIVLPWAGELSVQESMAQLRRATLLTTGRKGPFGTESINKRSSTSRGKFSPVLCVKNSYQLGVMNGDIGVLERSGQIDHIHFHHCSVPAVLCPRIEKAHAMTIHKSQGGEFETVVIVIPPGACCDRRLIYTAITRAKQRVVLIGRRSDFVQALERRDERMSTLSQRLRAELSC